MRFQGRLPLPCRADAPSWQCLAQSPADLPVFGDADAGYALSPFLRLSFEASPAQERLRTFPDTGLTLVRPTSESGLTLVFDHGPLGMPPSYGHGHADALSLILYDDSGPLLIDPGTYTYTGDLALAQLFSRDARAQHGASGWSAIRRGRKRPSCGQGRSVPSWSRPKGSGMARYGCSRGRRAISDLGVVHWRGVLFSSWLLIVWDGMLGSGVHAFEMNWHLGVDVTRTSENRFTLLADVRRTGAEFRSAGSAPLSEVGEMGTLRFAHPTNWGNGEISLRLTGGAVGLYRGNMDPILGWRSVLYGRKEAITTVSLVHQGRAPHEFLSIFYLKGTEPGPIDLDTLVDWFRQRVV